MKSNSVQFDVSNAKKSYIYHLFHYSFKTKLTHSTITYTIYCHPHFMKFSKSPLYCYRETIIFLEKRCKRKTINQKPPIKGPIVIYGGGWMFLIKKNNFTQPKISIKKYIPTPGQKRYKRIPFSCHVHISLIYHFCI